VIADIISNHIRVRSAVMFRKNLLLFGPDEIGMQMENSIPQDRFQVTSSPGITSQNLPDNSFGLDYHMMG
jgi:hypothetical protein